MRSVRYKIIETGVRLSRYKKMFGLDEAKFRAYIARRYAAQKTSPPGFIGRRHRLLELNIGGKPCYVITPKKDNPSAKAVLFLHGGGLFMETTPIHWIAVSKLVSRLRATVWLPVYPLAPRHTVKDATEMLLLVYAEMLKTHTAADIVFLGDSSGAVLSMILCQYNKTLSEPLPIPCKLILVSPGTEASPDGELLAAMKRIEPYDPMLSVAFMGHMGSLLAPGLDKTNYFLSPIYGDFSVLPEMHVFSGTYEIFYAQVPALVERARAAGVNAHLYTGEKMMHVWPYIPFAPESRKALAQIFELIG
ncbi:MAG TPA: alpha/beta hydrolase [Anaerovoracaceae bacterium]|nr:alpha/beta hydrolase [Anaerovoracaceae bacterium]